jgi:hypothetical protein
VRQDRQFAIAVFWFMEVDFPDDGGGRRQNMLECSLTLYEFYMCTVWDQILDNNFIDILSTNNIVKFTISIIITSILFPCANIL